MTKQPRRPITHPRRGARLNLETLETRLALSASAEFRLVNDWGSGFQGEIRIINDQNTPVTNWKLEFDFAKSITQMWNASVASQSGGHFVIQNAGWNGTIAPLASVSFGFIGTSGGVGTGPANYILNGTALGGGTGTPPPPPPPPVSVSASVSGATLTEGDSGNLLATFGVTLSAASTSPVTLNYSTADGTARAGLDYLGASGSLTFAPGERTKTVTVSVVGDRLDEADEDFTLSLSNPVGAQLGTGQARATILDNDLLPTLNVGDVTVTEPTAGATGGTSVGAGYFHTSGSQIVDAAGNTVRIAGVNWFGMESDTFAPHGLWARGYKEMMDQMKQTGFNTIRLPFSNQLFDAASVPNGIDFSKSPDLRGLNGLGVMDKIVSYAGQIGMRIFLDHHRPGAGTGTDGSGLWYTQAYPESRWISDWKMLAARYANNPTVIGADLHNEPHGVATWGDGSANDWRLAAERAGNAILSVNSNWLIIVEGVERASSGNYWWGGNLSNAGAAPVRLNTPGRLVYSAHDYPSSVFAQSWLSDPRFPNNLPEVWDRNWGYLFRQGIAPVLLGEFGTKLETAADRVWLQKLTSYLAGDLDGNGTNDLAAGQKGISWTYWSWNPNSGDTGGILKDDWTTVQQAKLDAVKSIQFPWGAAGTPTQATTTVSFTVSLAAASGRPVTVAYSTANGTASQGTDYVASTGTLTFAPGETQKTVTVTVLSDAAAEPAETFFLRLSDPQNALFADAEGLGTILNAIG